MSWSGLTLCTDTDLGELEPESTSGSWGATTWTSQRASAKKDLKIWLERDFSKKPDGTIRTDVCERVRDTYRADAVYGYTGGSYTDLTTTAGDETANDVALASVFATIGTDRLYLGFEGEADGFAVFMRDAFNAIASVMTVKYSGPAGWTALTASDGTSSSGKTFAKSGRVTWTIPTDWQRTEVNGTDELLWIEVSISVALTAGTKASQVLQVKAPEGLKKVVAWQALGYIAMTRAAQAPSTEYWMHKARNQWKTGYMDEADKLYESLRDKGGIPIDDDEDNVIDPEDELNLAILPTVLERR
jgi:hypothetical protein